MGRAERRRQEKANNQKPVYYQYTPQQIQEIRRQAVRDYQEKAKAEIRKMVEEEWELRKEAMTGESDQENLQKVLCLLISVPTKILCEEFGWKPIIKGRVTRLERFAEAVVNEVNRICEDEETDIRVYGEEVFEKYGVRYQLSD